jgi:glucose/arabinose dehydrogenase
MVNRNLIVGSDGSNQISGSNSADLIYGFDPSGPQSQASSIDAHRVATGLDQPVFVTSPPGDDSRLFIVERTGRIKIADLDSRQIATTAFLDISAEILADGERGLLGLAFDPQFASNGFFYVNLINTTGDTEVRRYHVSAGTPDVADAGSPALIVQIRQEPFSNHKAGWLDFGPDGFLYVATGDGGGGGDPNNNAQNGDQLLGKILRIDVRADGFPADPLRNYSIPSDNPFVGTAGADEVWAVGLRNPWRPSFDRGLGTFYIADVGQDTWEEIDIGQVGANYGWRVFEGPATFQPGALGPGQLTAPIFSYDRSVGSSITGGYVYRGQSDGLQGQYFFGDFISGQIFTLVFDGTAWVATERTAQIAPDNGAINNVASFGEDGSGNLYVVDFDGEIFRLTPVFASVDAHDSLRGLGGDDMIMAGAGDDYLFGGAGADTLNGGAGFDLARYDDATSGVVASLAAGRGSGGEAEGDVYISIEGLVGSDFADLLSGGDGNDMISGGAGIDAIDLGPGADILRDRLQDIAGEQIAGFSPTDTLAMEGSIVGRLHLGITTDARSATLTAGGFSFQLVGDFSGGDFMAVARGSGSSMHTLVTFEPFLPILREGTAVDIGSINGMTNEPFLTGDGFTRFAVELASAVSAHSNSLGAYRINADGTISDVTILFPNTLNVSADTRTADLGTPADGQRIGFFLIQDGFDIYGSLRDGLSFLSPDANNAADTDPGLPPILRSAALGTLTAAPIFHSIATLNLADANQVLSGVAPGGRQLLVGFEDLPTATSDNDFQDVVISVQATSDDRFIL